MSNFKIGGKAVVPKYGTTTFLMAVKNFLLKHLAMEQNNKIVLFQEKAVRRIWHNDQWFFSVVDVIEVLTGSPRPRKYWNALKTKLVKEGYTELSQDVGQLKMLSSDSKYYNTDAANTRTIFRIIMSVPSPKAEPFRQWLTQVGEKKY